MKTNGGDQVPLDVYQGELEVTIWEDTRTGVGHVAITVDQCAIHLSPTVAMAVAGALIDAAREAMFG